jgi:hypothetical protein
LAIGVLVGGSLSPIESSFCVGVFCAQSADENSNAMIIKELFMVLILSAKKKIVAKHAKNENTTHSLFIIFCLIFIIHLVYTYL